MNIVKVQPADIIIGSDHGITITTNHISRLTNYKPHGPGVSMSYFDMLLTFLRWKNQGWEVHPINLDDEFSGWI